MKVLHISRSPCAGAIEALSSAINDYTEHESRWIGTGDVGLLSFAKADHTWHDTACYALVAEADVVLLHNYVGTEEQPIKDLLDGDPRKRVAAFFHSHPAHCNRGLQVRGFPTFVPAQFQALLHKGSMPVRNVIRFDRADWPKVSETDRATRPRDRLVVGYAPTSHTLQGKAEKGTPDWYDSKGYAQTIELLERIEEADDRIELCVIDGVRYDMAIRLKAGCDVFIDEVVTGSYHRNSLEAFALGLVTIVNIDAEVWGVMERATGCLDWFPHAHATIENLEATIRDMAGWPLERRKSWGDGARAWMERFWHPRDIARDFCGQLEKLPSFEEVLAR